eukprot:SAG31_NODE_6044_length_2193_cov_2.593123_2_plen_414_part_01
MCGCNMFRSTYTVCLSCLSCGLQSASECGIPDSTRHLGTTKTSFDCETAHEPDTPFSAETLFGFGFVFESDMLHLTDIVCLPSEVGSAFASDVPWLKEIPSEPQTAYGSETLSWTDAVCLSSQLEAPYESDIFDSTDVVFLLCETGPAYASDVFYATDIPVETESARGSDFHFSAEISFDSRLDAFDIPYSTEIPGHTRSAYGSDLASTTEIPGHTGSSHGFDLSFSNETQNEFETPCAVHWIIIVFNLLRWYCYPKKLEERPECPRKRRDLKALDAKRKLSCVSTRLRHCVALAAIRKIFRAWRMKATNENYDRIGHVVGVTFLLIIMFQPVAEGNAVVSVTPSSTNMTQHHNETGGTNVHTDIHQLASLAVDSALKEFIGSLAVDLRELKRENAKMKNDMVAWSICVSITIF